MFLSLFTNKNKGSEFKRTPFFSSWEFQSVRPNSELIISTKTTRQTGVIDLQYRQSHVSFELPLSNSNIKQIASDKISFITSQNNIEPQYQSLDNGIKENLILHQIPTTNEFTTILKTTNADLYLTPDNLPVFLDPKTQQYLLHVEKPYAFDASGQKTYAVSYQLLKNGQAIPPLATATNGIFKLLGSLTKISPESSYQLVIKVDPKWLFSKSRTYPITIDPTVVHNTQTQFTVGSLNRIKDTGVGDTAPNLETYYQELATDQYTVGLWHLNESIGTTVADSSGNNRNGTDSGGSTIIAGKLDNARYFDNSDRIYIPASTDFEFGTNDFTIEAWVNFDSTVSTYRNVIGNYNPGWILGADSNGQMAFYDSTAWRSPAIPITTGWHHWTVSRIGPNLNFYLDGEYKATVNGVTTNIAGSFDELQIGKNDEWTTYFQNYAVDEVRISDIARTPEQIKADAQRRPYGVYTSPVIDLLGNAGTVKQWNFLSWTGPGQATGDGETLANTTGLVAQWNFNETSGTVASVTTGSCGVGCTGSLTNFADTSGQDVGGTNDGWTSTNRRWGAGALTFDGTDDYVKVNDNNSLDLTTAGSIEFWFKQSTRVNSVVFGKYSWNAPQANQRSYRIEVHNTSSWGTDGVGLLVSPDGSTENFANAVTVPYPTPGQWHHIVFTYDGSKLKGYTDGILQGTTTYNSNIFAGTAPLFLGGWSSDGTTMVGYSTGILDTTRIYSRALTPDEILKNYNAANLEFQTRSSPDGLTWEEWKGAVGDSQIDSADATNDYWGIDTNPNADSTTVKSGTINVGSGADGACMVASGTVNLNTQSCAGRATADAVNFSSTTLTGVGATGITLSSSPAGLAAGAEILIINLQGTSPNFDSVGKYEVHTISSINGNTLIFTDYPVKYSYDGTTQKIMVERVPNYTNVTINSGTTMTINGWDGSVGGVLFFKANGTVTNNGSISTNFKGYRGAPHFVAVADYSWGYVGESEGVIYQTTRQPNGFGLGGGGGNGQAGGGGGGYNSPGFNGASAGCTTGGGGLGGNNGGNTSLEGLRFGGSGGASGSHSTGGREGASGGASGGIISILANSITSSGTISSVGATGENGYKAASYTQPLGGGGGGAGGTIQIKANTVSITGALNAFGGTGGGSNASDSCTPSGRGGDAGTGRISIYYSNSYTNSVSLNTTNTGSGADGECTVPGSTNLNTQSCSGRATADAISTTSTVSTAAGSNSIAVGSTVGLSIGNEILIINLQGTSLAYDTAGRYETVTINSFTGNTIYFSTGLVNSYDGTTQKIMVERVPNYTNVTINAGSVLTANAWGGTTGGVIFFRVNGILNNAGTILGTGLGYRGGAGYNTYNVAGYGVQGESYRGNGASANVANAGGGGGGYCYSNCASSGGGGSNAGPATAGGVGTTGTGGAAGIAYAGQSIERLNLGSGGGGGADTNNGTVGVGGRGGGIVFISAANINNTGSFIANGSDGTTGNRGANGGGGGGGSNYIINNLNSFGTITSTAGGVGGLGGAGLNVSQIINPKAASSVQKTGSLIKQEGTNSLRFDAGISQADSSTIGLWHLDETDPVQSPIIYNSTGTNQNYVVPAGVTSLVVKAWGGGGGGGNYGGWTYGYPGGGGGYATGTIAVTPGQVLTIVVGAGGTNGSAAPTVNSYGGGGKSCQGSDCQYGGQGGGRSAIQTGGNDIITAGGGGGGGATGTITNNMTGGAGGGSIGQNGFSYALAGVGGSGGSQSTGGAGGAGTNSNGTAGSQYQGGSPAAGSYGGGGGGGWYGGGGGAYTNGNAMGGGGGGSSYVSGAGMSDGSMISGSGSVPGNVSDPYFGNGYSRGGSASANGQAGKVIIFAKDSQGNIINTINDSSDYHQTASLVGTTIVSGITNQARSFDNGTITINDSPSLNPINITLETWAKTSSTANFYFIYKHLGVSPLPGYSLGIGSSRVDCWVGGSTLTYGTSTINDNKWHHLACTYDGTNVRVYVDGKLEATQAQTGNLSNKNNLYIGNYSNASLDEIRLSNIARTPEEIMESYRLGANHRLSRPINTLDLSNNSKLPFAIAGNRLGTNLELTIGNNPFVNYEPDANTAGLWHLDESDVGSSGATTAFIKDATGNGNNATPGVGSFYPTFTTGKIGFARSFNGSSTYITTPDSDSLSFTNNVMSVDTWIRKSSVPAAVEYIILKGVATWEYALAVNPNGTIYGVLWQSGGAGVASVSGSISVIDGNWHHVAMVSTGSKLSIFVDGKEDKSTSTFTGNMGNTGASLYFGIRPGATNSEFEGLIDEVRISNIARSAADIRAAYEYGSRTHQITIDFKAKPDSSGIGVNALSFNLDETSFGASSKLPHLFVGDKLIAQENIGGTEYLAQGPVATVNSSSGAVTLDSWDVGSSFPASGFSSNATIFKWQQEFFDLKGSLFEQRNNINRLTMRITDGSGGGSYWLDDFRTVTNLMNNAVGSSISSTFNRFFQYRAIESTSDTNVSTALQAVSFDYLRNYAPNTPSLITPPDGTTNLQATISLGTSSTDLESDFIRYKIKICTNVVMSVGCTVYDQTVDQAGWTGQDTQVGTAYNSGSMATLVATLPYNNTYYWQSQAIDPAGSNVWSNAQAAPWSFATSYSPVVPSLLFPTDNAINQRFILDLGTSTSDPDNDPIMYKITLCTDINMTQNCQIHDQTVSQVGWTGQDIGTSAYSSNTTATYTLQTALLINTRYYWKSQAIDPTGSNLWGPTQAVPFKFTTTDVPLPPTNCLIEEAVDDSFLKLKWVNHALVFDGFVIERRVDGAGYAPLTTVNDVGATDFSDTNVPENHTYQYRVAAYIAGPYYSPWCESPLLNLGGVLPIPTPTPAGPTPSIPYPTRIPENGILIY